MPTRSQRLILLHFNIWNLQLLPQEAGEFLNFKGEILKQIPSTNIQTVVCISKVCDLGLMISFDI